MFVNSCLVMFNMHSLQIDPHKEARRIAYPVLFQHLCGFNQPEKHKHKAEPLSSAWLVEQHGLLLIS